MPHRERKSLRAWQRPFQWLFELGEGATLALCVALSIGLAIIDVMTPPELNLAFAYTLIILLATWNIGPAAGVVFAAIASCLQYANLHGMPVQGSIVFWWVVLLNRVFTFAMAVVLTGALRRMYDILQERSLRDALTDAVNASYFLVLLRSEIARAARSGQPFTLAYLDLDDFKSVNTQHGHLKGDAVLRAVVETARQNIRGIDIIARLGGDEFALIFPQTDELSAVRVLNRLQAGLREAMRGLHVETSASIGALIVRSPAVTADEVLSAGDELMFRAKKEGKDRVVHETLRAPGSAALKAV